MNDRLAILSRAIWKRISLPINLYEFAIIEVLFYQLTPNLLNWSYGVFKLAQTRWLCFCFDWRFWPFHNIEIEIDESLFWNLIHQAFVIFPDKVDFRVSDIDWENLSENFLIVFVLIMMILMELIKEEMGPFGMVLWCVHVMTVVMVSTAVSLIVIVLRWIVGIVAKSLLSMMIVRITIAIKWHFQMFFRDIWAKYVFFLLIIRG